jgi:hypothetical protein
MTLHQVQKKGRVDETHHHRYQHNAPDARGCFGSRAVSQPSASTGAQEVEHMGWKLGIVGNSEGHAHGT